MMIAGIDLGTTNSLVSVWQGTEAYNIPNALGKKLTPSVVGIDDNGEILIGLAAKERLITHPEKSVALFKRYMGSDKQFSLGNHHFRPEELSSFVLRSLKEDIEAYTKEKVNEAIISVPAYFSDPQRKATRIAGQLAGFTVHRLINEPTAAAVAYGLHKKKEEATVLVFDLGGGTFDVSILEFYNGVMEVRATAGDNFLGGEDFLHLIVDAFIQQNNIDRKKLDPRILSNLIHKAESLKMQLTTRRSATIQLKAQGRDIEWKLTRDEFESMSTGLLTRLRRPVERALLDARIKCKQIEDVVLIGGATRMPMVRKIVAGMLGRFPFSDIDPDEAVALGAGVQGGLKARDKALQEIFLTDVCPYTLGVEVAYYREEIGYQSGNFAPIMERGITIPVSKQERFQTIYDGQKKVEVIIYQGESRKIKDNIKLGKLVVEVPDSEAGREAIDVRFTYNIDGILEVEVTVVSTGLKKTIIIEEAPGILTAEQIQQRLSDLAALKIHPRDNIENRTLLAKGERLYESRLQEDRRRIAEAIFNFESAIDRQEPKSICKTRIALEQVITQIETDGGGL
jgi:molecular chaperone HscC